MKMLDILVFLKHKNLISQTEYADIEEIQGDVVGVGSFANILLTLGAFISCILVVLLVLSIIFVTEGFDGDNIWIYIAVFSAVMLTIGYMSYSNFSLYKLRLSTFFIIVGMAAIVALVAERVGYYFDFNYTEIIKHINYFMVIL